MISTSASVSAWSAPSASVHDGRDRSNRLTLWAIAAASSSESLTRRSCSTATKRNPVPANGEEPSRSRFSRPSCGRRQSS